MQRSIFKHFLELPVRWGDMDAFGHVNNVQYMRYLESARVAYLEAVLRQRMDSSGESIVLADIQCSFLRQLHYPATIEVGSRVIGIGKSSFQLGCAIYLKGEQQPAATSKAVLVWFDFARQRSQPVPAAVRKTIMAYEMVES